MKNSTIAFILFAIAAALLIGGCSQYGGDQEAQQAPAATESPAVLPPPPPPPSAGQVASANTIEITASGFSPSPLTIKAGDTVTFVNKDSAQHWPASAVHPTHAVYPEAGGCIGSKFDACKGLAAGETFEFTFNEKGTWKYHDHLNPSLWGTIVVE
ncbi:cupredoxin domain-containing protein [Candidatus Woesearchaeota archaeon]|nr:cupredoxin domain-containing protein [Candidatus Woesearchaeota archaeon]